MILENKGKEFDIKFDGKGFNIPEGKFEVEAKLGHHIVAVTGKWEGVDIVVIETDAKPEIRPAVEPVVEAPAEEAPAEAPVEEAPAEEAPVEEAPVEEAPAEEAPVEEAPVEEAK